MFKLNPTKLVLFFVAVLGLCFTFLVPPFQKPDENRHFYQASALARGVWHCQRNAIGEVYLPLPASVYNFPNSLKVDEIAHTPKYKFFLSQLTWDLSDNSEVVEARDWCSWSFVGYIPSSFGVLIGRITQINLIEFYLARLISIIFFFTCLAISLRIVPDIFQKWILLYALLPMTTHQASSISYDSLQLSLLPIIFAYTCRFLMPQASKPKRFTPTIFITLLLIFVLAKPICIIFLLLIYLIPGLSWPKSTLIILLTSLITLPFLKPLHYLALESGVNPELQLHLITRDPLYYVQVFLKTITTDQFEIIKGLIGNFGWLDYQLPLPIYFAFLILFGYLVGVSKPTPNPISKKAWIILTLMPLGYYIATYTALYLSWTSVGYPRIKGVQGRYFLLLIPYLGLLAAQLAHQLSTSTRAKLAIFSLAILTLLLVIVSSIYHRYWDYSDYGINDRTLPSKNSELTELNSGTFPLLLEGSAKGVGFYFYLKDGDSPFATYRFEIRSENCQKKEVSGYFSIPNPDRDPHIVIYTKPFPVKNDSTCLELEKLAVDQPSTVEVIEQTDGLLIRPLYLVPSLSHL